MTYQGAGMYSYRAAYARKYQELLLLMGALIWHLPPRHFIPNPSHASEDSVVGVDGSFSSR